MGIGHAFPAGQDRERSRVRSRTCQRSSLRRDVYREIEQCIAIAKRLATSELEFDSRLAFAGELAHRVDNFNVQSLSSQEAKVRCAALYAELVVQAATQRENEVEAQLIEARLLAKPAEDERSTFERVWTLLEIAMESRVLSPSVEAELRSMRSMLDTSRTLEVTDPAGDLLEAISRRIDEVLISVANEMLADSAPQDLTDALRASSSDAPEADQLRAIGRAAASAIEVADALSPAISTQPPPFQPQLMALLETQRKRLDATVDGLSLIEGSIGQMFRLKTVQVIYRTGQWVISTTLLTALQHETCGSGPGSIWKRCSRHRYWGAGICAHYSLALRQTQAP